MWPLTMLIWSSFGGYGYWIASVKRRSPAEGILFGLLLGPIGCVVEATRRERTAEEVEELRFLAAEEAEARAVREGVRLAASQVEADRRRQEAQERAEQARLRLAYTFHRFAGWFDRAVLKFGWFKVLPEVVQPIVIGVSLGLPVVAMLIYLFRGR